MEGAESHSSGDFESEARDTSAERELSSLSPRTHSALMTRSVSQDQHSLLKYCSFYSDSHFGKSHFLR